MYVYDKQVKSSFASHDKMATYQAFRCTEGIGQNSLTICTYSTVGIEIKCKKAKGRRKEGVAGNCPWSVFSWSE
jgi:predicted secreted protein